MKVILATVFCLLATFVSAKTGVIVNGDNLQLHLSNVPLNAVMTNIALQKKIGIIGSNLLLPTPVSANRKFKSIEVGINYLLKEYNKVFIYDQKGLLTQIKIFGFQDGRPRRLSTEKKSEKKFSIDSYPEQPPTLIQYAGSEEPSPLFDDPEPEEPLPSLFLESDPEEQPSIFQSEADIDEQPTGIPNDVDIGEQPPLIMKDNGVGQQPPI